MSRSGDDYADLLRRQEKRKAVVASALGAVLFLFALVVYAGVSILSDYWYVNALVEMGEKR